MLRAVHGNRAEALLGALLEALPPADPFAPTTIVVGSHLVARWLTREIAFARGIAAGLELVTFDRFVERDVGGDAPRAGSTRSIAPARGGARVGARRRRRRARRCPPVASYLAAAPDGGDRAGPRRVQLAEHLAELAWSYAHDAAGLDAGAARGPRADRARRRSDRRVAGRADRRGVRARIAARPRDRVPLPMLPWARRRARAARRRRSRRRSSVFGVSFLQRAQLEALTRSRDDERRHGVPARSVRGAVGRRRRPRAADAGAAIRCRSCCGAGRCATRSRALVERTGGDVEDAFVERDADATARERLLADVLAAPRRRRPPVGGDPRRAGVTVLACPNPRREIEVVAGEVARAASTPIRRCARTRSRCGSRAMPSATSRRRRRRSRRSACRAT